MMYLVIRRFFLTVIFAVVLADFQIIFLIETTIDHPSRVVFSEVVVGHP